MNIGASVVLIVGAAMLTHGAPIHAATYSTVRQPDVAPPLLRLSISRSRPGCTDTQARCVATSPPIDALAVAPGEPFSLAFGCDAQPVHGVVRLRHLYVPIETLVQNDCRTIELVVDIETSSTHLTVDDQGHRYTRAIEIGDWTPLQLIDAEPLLYLRLEHADPTPR